MFEIYTLLNFTLSGVVFIIRIFLLSINRLMCRQSGFSVENLLIYLRELVQRNTNKKTIQL